MEAQRELWKCGSSGERGGKRALEGHNGFQDRKMELFQPDPEQTAAVPVTLSSSAGGAQVLRPGWLKLTH